MMILIITMMMIIIIIITMIIIITKYELITLIIISISFVINEPYDNIFYHLKLIDNTSLVIIFSIS